MVAPPLLRREAEDLSDSLEEVSELINSKHRSEGDRNLHLTMDLLVCLWVCV